MRGAPAAPLRRSGGDRAPTENAGRPALAGTHTPMASDPVEIPKGVPEDRVDALYGLPLDEFTPSRDALAKELRGEGRREEADWVKALPKPSAPAWVVNQLARTQGQPSKRLLEAGDALREAHERLLAGEGGAEDLRSASEEEDGAVRKLRAAASGLLDSAGNAPSRSTLERAEQTLRAVALDERTRAAFGAGRLIREQAPTGLGPFAPAAGAAQASARRQSANKAKGGRAAAGKARRGAGEGATGQRGKGAAAKGRRAATDDAERRRAAAEKELQRAKDELRDRREAREAAEAEQEQARAEAERAEQRLQQAAKALEQARSREREAEARVAEQERAAG